MKYFFQERKLKKAHIWENNDTLCHMWNDHGGFTSKKGYVICENKEGRKVCSVCTKKLQDDNRYK